MVKTVRIMQPSANGDEQQVYPFTHTLAIYDFSNAVNALIAQALQVKQIASGTDLNSLVTVGLYSISGVKVSNGPNGSTGYASITIIPINNNSCTQLYVDDRNHRWTRSRYGQAHNWTSWSNFN